MTPTERPGSRPAAVTQGLLLTAGPVEEVADWAARGVVPVVVAPLGERTVLVPQDRPAVRAPYDDAATLCAARPAPVRAAPTLGCWLIGERAVLTVQSRHRRRQVSWVVWDPEHGVLRPPGIERASARPVVAAAGGGSRAELTAMLAELHHPPVRLLQAVLDILGLPGAHLLAAPRAAQDLPGARVLLPDRREVGYFEDAVRDAVLLRRELGAEV
ncbi:MAG: hypothetical protein ACR2FV_09875 [Ornithinimicrobium sp.]|uniref:hypothetical protein n=1 Tax=Ornithinimicrobium sp. TaxID=1977084 RepID=UPI003D9ABAF9